MIKENAYPLVDVAEKVEEESSVQFPWVCILFNDEIHSFDEVIFQVMKATGCSSSKAEKIAYEVDSKGKAVVYSGDIDECLKVSTILEEIYLQTEVQG